jgi:hypothetical protein
LFLGHFAVGFGAKAAAPGVSLGSLFLAAQFIDLLWPTLLMLDMEQVRITPAHPPGPPLEFVHYPISHSLLAVLGWAVLVGASHFLLRREHRSAWIMGLAVLSHWLLDLLVHYPDLPLHPGPSPMLGLSLWASPSLAMLLELGLFVLGVELYLSATRPVDATGKWALAGLALFLVVIQISNAVGPPPPSVTALAWVGQAQWLLVAWGYWVDRHRRPAKG